MDLSYFIRQITEGYIDTPDKGDYTPTAVIGLGGTGCRSLRYFKDFLVRHKERLVPILGIDTDDTENGKLPGLPVLDDSELLILHSNEAVSALERARAGVAEDQYILDFLPDEAPPHHGLHAWVRGKIGNQTGAGQFRRAGKLLLLANALAQRSVESRLEDLSRELAGLGEAVRERHQGVGIRDEIRIYVVSSVCGGSGAGMLLDFLALLRQTLPNDNVSVYVVGILPGKLLDRKLTDRTKEGPQTRAIAVGVLRELQPFLMGAAQNHVFKFPGNREFQLGTQNLVSATYLIDHETTTGRPVDAYSELWRSAAVFLYSQTAGGIADEHAAGVINQPLPPNYAAADKPPVFHAFGVSAIEIPVKKLIEYSLRRDFDTVLSAWMGSPKSDGKCGDSSAAFLNGVGAGTPDALRSTLTPVIPEKDYLTDDALRKQVMGMWDAQFLGEAHQSMNSFPAALLDYDPKFEERLEQLGQRFRSTLEKDTIFWLSLGRDSAAETLLKVGAQLKKWKETNSAETKSAAAELDALPRELSRKEKWINRIDLWLDRGLRTNYIKLVQRKLDLETRLRADQSIQRFLREAIREVNSTKNRISEFGSLLENTGEDNREALDTLGRDDAQSHVVQSSLDGDQLENWYEQNRWPGGDLSINLNKLSLDDFLSEALKGAFAHYDGKIRAENLVNAAYTDPSIKNRVLATAIACEPLMGMTADRPARNQMSPQNYLIGTIAEKSELHDEFKTIAGGDDVSVLNHPNRLMVINVQTIHGFGAGHWKGLSMANEPYQNDQWLYHTISNSQLADLPPLVRPTRERSLVAYQFAIAWAMEGIRVAGSHYYLNIAQLDTADFPKFGYLSFRKLEGADDEFPASVALVDSGLVSQAPKARTRPDSDYRFGNGLENAFKEFQSPELSNFRGELDQLVMEAQSTLGINAFRDQLKSFADSCLESQRTGADGERREILDELIQALRDNGGAG